MHMNSIRRHRLRAGLTQAELALRAHISQPALSQIERGITRPKLDTLKRIAKILGRRVELVGPRDVI